MLALAYYTLGEVDQAIHVFEEWLWEEPDESFVCGLYWLLLGRMGDPEGIAAMCRAIATGTTRADIVRAVALSEEAASQKLDVSWLPRLDDHPPAPPLLSFACLRSAFLRLRALRSRGFWSRIKKRVRRTNA